MAMFGIALGLAPQFGRIEKPSSLINVDINPSKFKLPEKMVSYIFCAP
jgi:hypothetical protein